MSLENYTKQEIKEALWAIEEKEAFEKWNAYPQTYPEVTQEKEPKYCYLIQVDDGMEGYKFIVHYHERIAAEVLENLAKSILLDEDDPNDIGGWHIQNITVEELRNCTILGVK